MHRRPRNPTSLQTLFLLVATLLVTNLFTTACSSSPSASNPTSPSRGNARIGDVVPLEPRVDLVMGHPLVIPVQIPDRKYQPGPIPSRLEDGRDPGALLVWFAVTPDPLEPTRWLPPSGNWRATTAPAPGDTQGFWAIVVNMPLDAIGQGLWIGGGRIDLNWIPPALTDDADDARAALAPVMPDAGLSPGLAALLEPEFRSPIRRWRVKLLSEGLLPSIPANRILSDPERDQPVPAPDAAQLSSSRALELLASQYEARWSVALARIWRDDPDLCQQLRRTLCAVVRLEGNATVPAWPLRAEGLDELSRALLDPRASSATRLRAARLFIERQPIGLAWVIDDAGLIDGNTGRSLSTLGLVNLSDRATLGWAAPTRTESVPSLVPIEPQRGLTLTSLASPTNRVPTLAGPGSAFGEIIAHVGRWNATWLVVSEPLLARPPGVRAGPFVPGWTLSTWLAGAEPRPAPEDAPWTAAALIERLPGTQGVWSIYVECLRPESAGNDADSVRLWLGPRNLPLARIRVSRDGSATNELDSAVAPTLITPVVPSADRWAFRLEIPASAIDADGTLMLGLERFGSGARRWSWPRAMTPWQTEPGRLRINLKDWEGLSRE